MRILVVIAMILAVAGAATPAARAQGNHDHNRARALVRSGQIQPLNVILGQVRGQVPARVLGVDLQGDGQRRPWMYDVRVLTPQGNVVQIQVNARTANIVGFRGRGAQPPRAHRQVRPQPRQRRPGRHRPRYRRRR